MNGRHYLLVKEQKEEKKTTFHYDANHGFHMKPRNKVKYDGIIVNKLRVHDQKFIQKLLKRKIKLKLNLYLNYLITYLEDGGEDGTTDLRHALNDLSRYKEVVKGKYRKYLEEKYMKLLLKKIEILEKDIAEKVRYAEMSTQYEKYYQMYEAYAEKENENTMEETRGKSR